MRAELTGSGRTISLIMPNGRTPGAKFYFASGTTFGEASFLDNLDSTEFTSRDSCGGGFSGKLLGKSDGFSGTVWTYTGMTNTDAPPPPVASAATLCPGSGSPSPVMPTLVTQPALPTDSVITYWSNMPIDAKSVSDLTMGGTLLHATGTAGSISLSPSTEAFAPGLTGKITTVKDVLGQTFSDTAGVKVLAPKAFLLSLPAGASKSDAVALQLGTLADSTGTIHLVNADRGGIGAVIGIGGTDTAKTLKVSHRFECRTQSGSPDKVWIVSSDGMKMSAPVSCGTTPTDAEITLRGKAPYYLVVSAVHPTPPMCNNPGAPGPSAYELTSATLSP